MSGLVVVRGSATVEAQPDAARLRIEARARARDAAGAHRDVAAVAAAVDAVLAAHADAVRKRSTSGLLVVPAHEWTDKGRRSVGWDGSRTTSVELADPAAIGAVFAGVADAGAIAGGLQWVLDPSNPAHAEARTTAAVDARARAEAYAAALGIRLGDVVEVREPATHPAGGDHIERAMFARAGGVEAEVAVEAPDLQVTAEVDVTFTLLG